MPRPARSRSKSVLGGAAAAGVSLAACVSLRPCVLSPSVCVCRSDLFFVCFHNNYVIGGDSVHQVGDVWQDSGKVDYLFAERLGPAATIADSA